MRPAQSLLPLSITAHQTISPALDIYIYTHWDSCVDIESIYIQNRLSPQGLDEGGGGLKAGAVGGWRGLLRVGLDGTPGGGGVGSKPGLSL